MAVLGGMRHLSGGVIGGFILTWMPELLRLRISGFENYYLIINCVIVLLIVVFLPNGLGESLFKGLARLWGDRPGAMTLKVGTIHARKPEPTGQSASPDADSTSIRKGM
jgi:hypothetical protein